MPSPFTHRIRVRYNECDQQNAVFNAHYLTYCDVAITELWRAAFGAYAAMADLGVDLVVAEANIRFFRAARFDDELDVGVEIERLGETSITTRFAIDRDRDHIAEARLRHVFIDVSTSAKASIPDRIRDGLTPYLAP